MNVALSLSPAGEESSHSNTGKPMKRMWYSVICRLSCIFSYKYVHFIVFLRGFAIIRLSDASEKRDI